MLRIEEILDITGGVLVSGRPDGEITGVTIDSRSVIPGQLFVALAGKRYDGHDFLASAREQGAKGAMVERDVSLSRDGWPIIRVADTVRALGDLARKWRERFRGPVIAITGSTGKTTTKEMTATILGKRWSIYKSVGNYNNLIGLPLTILGLKGNYEMLVVELGTNYPGEIARLTNISQPTIACITNVGPAHLEGLRSLAGVAREKGALLEHMRDDGVAVINVDDPYVVNMARKKTTQVVTYGRGGEAWVTVRDDFEVGSGGTYFTLAIGGKEARVELPALGEHNVTNALAASAIAWAAGATLEDIVSGLKDYHPFPGRMEMITLKRGIRLINDVYNANPASCFAALKTLEQLRGPGRTFVVLGDMKELGEEGERWHRFVGRKLVETGVEKAYLRGELVPFVAHEARDMGWPAHKIILFQDVQEIVADLEDQLAAGDWVLVKGSRGMKMEEVVAAIVQHLGFAQEEEA